MTTAESKPFHIHIELNYRELEAFYYALYSARSTIETRIAKGYGNPEKASETLVLIEKITAIQAT